MHQAVSFIFHILFSFCVWKTAFACNGYTLKVNYIRNCIPNSVYKMDNFGVDLDKDCNIVTSGCIEITKAFKTAVGKYSLKKPPMPAMEGDIDFCKAAEEMGNDPMTTKVSNMFGFPKTCPVKQPKKGCGSPDKKINISKYKNQLGLATGTSEIKLEADHDTGKSCIEMSVTIKKGKRG